MGMVIKELKDYLKSSGCGFGFSTDREKMYIEFHGKMMDEKNDEISAEEEEIVIEFPARSAIKIVMELIRTGLEYQDKTGEDIGFGNGGINHE